MRHETIETQRTAHYYQLGLTGTNIRQFWLVCHGYAQVADEFLEHFRCLDDGNTLVVAPEGMNHFYRKGFGGPVGATWMTARHRDSAIRDNARYLAALDAHFSRLLPPDVQKIVLGFSQGTATVCRWMAARQPHFHHLVLWGGLPPEDLDYRPLADYLADKHLHHVMGDADPFITPERIALFQSIRDRNALTFHEISYSGAHDIPADVLSSFRKDCIQ